MSFTFDIEWLSDTVHTVQVTGDFDDWSRSLPEVTGKTFKQTVRMDSRTDISFKFIVDGVWCVDSSYRVDTDSEGNENNVIPLADLKSAGEESIASPVEEASLTDQTISGEPEASNVEGEKSEPAKSSEESEKLETGEIHITHGESVETVIPEIESPTETQTANTNVESENEVTPESDVSSPKVEVSEGTEEIPVQDVTIDTSQDTEGIPDPESSITSVQEDDDVHNDEAIISDFDESFVSKDFPEPAEFVKPLAPLVPTDTGNSSFAAVSIPSTSEEYHEVQNEYEPQILRDEDFDVDDTQLDEDFDTPTNSLFNSTVIPPSSSGADGLGSVDTTTTTTGSASKASPNIIKPNSSAFDDTHSTRSTASGPSAGTEPPVGKRDNLISRFRGLFKY